MDNSSAACPRCGAQRLRADARFCHCCGEPLPPIPNEPPTGGRARRWTLLAVPAALALVAILVALAWDPLVLRLLPHRASPTSPTARAAATLAATAQPATTNTPWAIPIATLAGPAATSATTPGPTPNARVASGGDALRVRTGPGTNYPRVSHVHDGDSFDVLGRNAAGDWYYVRLPDGGEGWVAAEWVQTSLSTEAIPVAAAEPPPQADPNFRADQYAIAAGACTTLRWDVEGVDGVYLDGRGVEGHGSLVACLAETQTYTLVVLEPGGRSISWPLTIEVFGADASTVLE